MIEIISYILAIAAIAFVAQPLIFKKSGQISAKQNSTQFDNLLNQRKLVVDTKADLEFDFQTGKLDKEDYELLAREQDEHIEQLDKTIQGRSGISANKLTEQLENEISQKRKKIQPDVDNKCKQCSQPLAPQDKFCSKCGAQQKA